jgi:hypothetical protein
VGRSSSERSLLLLNAQLFAMGRRSPSLLRDEDGRVDQAARGDVFVRLHGGLEWVAGCADHREDAALLRF